MDKINILKPAGNSPFYAASAAASAAFHHPCQFTCFTMIPSKPCACQLFSSSALSSVAASLAVRSPSRSFGS